MNYQERIDEIRAQFGKLDAQLDENRTPHLKQRIRFAGHCLDDAVSVLQHAETSVSPSDAASFRAFAAHSMGCAAGIVLTTTAIVKNHGPNPKSTDSPARNRFCANLCFAHGY